MLTFGGLTSFFAGGSGGVSTLVSPSVLKHVIDVVGEALQGRSVNFEAAEVFGLTETIAL